MITLVEAKQRQDELQREGQILLDDLKLVERLERLGEVEVTGSFSYGLMAMADLDFYVFNQSPSLAAMTRLVSKFIARTDVIQTIVTNFYDHKPHAGVPRGLYCGVRMDYMGRDWHFDIWLLQPSDRPDTKNFPANWHTNLSAQQRDCVLLIKYQLLEKGYYPLNRQRSDTFGSADIYRAVMNDGVETVEQLQKWREAHPYY